MKPELHSRFKSALVGGDRNRALEHAASLAAEGRDAARAGLSAVSDVLFGHESDATAVRLPWLAELIARLGDFTEAGGRGGRVGRIVVGTVVGDGFEPGQALFVQSARCEDFEVVDLGVGIPAAEFAGAVRAQRPVALAILCHSPVCAGNAAVVIEELERQSLRDVSRVLLAGPSLDAGFAAACGADAFAARPVEAVAILRDWALSEGSGEALNQLSNRPGST